MFKILSLLDGLLQLTRQIYIIQLVSMCNISLSNIEKTTSQSVITALFYYFCYVKTVFIQIFNA